MPGVTFASALKGQRSGAGSAAIAGSFALSGALTYAFQSVYFHALGKQGSAPLVLLWTATFLTVQVLWVGGTQTLGRYVAEREAQGRNWEPVLSSVRRWQGVVLVAFLVLALPSVPLLTRYVFEDAWIPAPSIIVVALSPPDFFRRAIFTAHRQSFRLGGQIVAE